MKRFLNYWIIIAMIPLVIVSSCKKDDDDDPTPAVSSFETLKTYMMNNSLDLTDLLNGWVIAPELIAKDVNGIVDPNDHSIPGYHVFDIRSADAFNAGHIKNAINVPLADVVTTAQNYTDKPILVVCVTGQTAGHAVMALRLSGFSDAQVLKWGMSGWNTSLAGSWENNVGDIAVGHTNWTTTAASALGSFDNPSWTSNSTDGAAILAERVNAMLTNGFKAVGSDVVLDAPGNYQIMNFWSEADYTTFGHFVGAYQIQPISLANDVTKAFDPAAESAVYCYTGQTSSMATAWLNVLGYNAVSIKFGVNSLSYTALSDAGKPHWHGANDYTVYTD